MDEQKLRACLTLFRRLPPHQIEENLSAISLLSPHLSDEMYQRIDQPLKILVDPKNGRQYLGCDYNRDGDAYRSPWSNEYYPIITEDEESFYPSERIRNLEIQANELFDIYRELYYQGGISSAYLWDTDHGLAACVVFRKDVFGERNIQSGTWNAIHVIQVQEGLGEADAYDGKSAMYQLTTTLQTDMIVSQLHLGKTRLCGHLTRQCTKTLAFKDASSHLENFGKVIEDLESETRTSLDALYVAKTREVVNGMRRVSTRGEIVGGGLRACNVANELAGAVQKHGVRT